MKIKFKKNSGAIVGLSVTSVLMSALIFGNTVAFANMPVISQYFNQSYYKVVQSDEEERPVYYESKYKNMRELQAEETKFAEQAQAEGSVLLQNKGLPLKANSKITFLGSDSADGIFLVSGGGSGAIDTTKTPPLKKVFEDNGYSVNPTMIDFYGPDGAGRSTRASGNNVVGEAPQSAYTSVQTNSYKDYSDAAIVFIGRQGQEGSDVQTKTKEDPSKHMLELSQNEMDLIDSAIEHFDNVVVLLNTLNPMELGWLQNKKVSVVWVGAGGQQGLLAIPKLLNGTYNFSGRLIDTYVYDNYSSPAMVNFGSFEYTNVSDANFKYYYNYAENIYIGYKYYETRYADKVMNVANVGSYDYSEQVVYPFGYGLSYTSFQYKNFKVTEKSKEFVVDVTVENTGNAAGKEVVEIYLQKPYTEYDKTHHIEKPAIELAGFAKTKDEVQPGKSEVVTVTIPKESLRNYDAEGFKTYIVEAGTYTFSVGHNAHDALNNILTKNGYAVGGNEALVSSYEQSETDSVTYSKGEDGKQISNQFEGDSWKEYDESFRYLTRSDWTGTWPEPLGGEEHKLEASQKLLNDLVPVTVTPDPNAKMPTTGAKNGLTLASMVGVEYDSEYWDLLLDQMSAKEMMTLVAQGGFCTVPIESIAKPATVEKDGPAGISATLIGGAGCFGYPVAEVMASAWNIELEELVGFFMGEDALLSNIAGVYGPACNMHRTPFSGRNFEYFSEDSFLSGVFTAAMVKNLEAKGVYTYTKHFALNDQETNRHAATTFATEQVIREIYLRPFEMAVREGGASALMTAKNRIGVVWIGCDKNLMTNVLRGEWGFRGHVITDAENNYVADFDAKIALDAGLSLYLCGGASTWSIEGVEKDAATMQNLRKACHDILYNVANSLAMNNISRSAKFVFSMPAWGICLIAVDVVASLLTLTEIFFVLKGMKNKKEAN